MQIARIRPHILFVTLISCFATSAGAQIDSSLFTLHWEDQPQWARTLDEISFIPAGDIDDPFTLGEDELSVFRWDSTGHIKLARDATDPAFTLGYRFLTLSLGGDGLPVLPDDFNDLALVGAYRFPGDGDWRISLLGGAGTANDGHWTNADAIYGIGAIDFEKRLDTDSVLHLGIEYYGNRLYLPEAPLPSVRYESRWNKDVSFVLGFPTSQLRWEIGADVSLEAFWTLAQRLRVTGSWGLSNDWSIFAEFEQTADAFYIDGTGGDRLFYELNRVVGGVRWKSDFVDAQFGVGYAFGQEFTTGDNIWSANGLNEVGDGVLLMVNLRGTF